VLCETFKDSLVDTYKSYEHEATVELLELLFTSTKFRQDAINRVRNADITRFVAAYPQFISHSLAYLKTWRKFNLQSFSFADTRYDLGTIKGWKKRSYRCPPIASGSRIGSPTFMKRAGTSHER
jgi:hypothetical protein